jgi:hypothetical protein
LVLSKHFVTSCEGNAESAIFRTRDEGKSVLGEIYNVGNHCRGKEKRDVPYKVDGLSVNDLKQLERDRKKWCS